MAMLPFLATGVLSLSPALSPAPYTPPPPKPRVSSTPSHSQGFFQPFFSFRLWLFYLVVVSFMYFF